jgi:hypothetical protein
MPQKRKALDEGFEEQEEQQKLQDLNISITRLIECHTTSLASYGALLQVVKVRIEEALSLSTAPVAPVCCSPPRFGHIASFLYTYFSAITEIQTTYKLLDDQEELNRRLNYDIHPAEAFLTSTERGTHEVVDSSPDATTLILRHHHCLSHATAHLQWLKGTPKGTLLGYAEFVINNPDALSHDIRVNRIVQAVKAGKRYELLKIHTGCKAAPALPALIPRPFRVYIKEDDIQYCGVHLRSCYFSPILHALKQLESSYEKVQKAVNKSLQLTINNKDFSTAIDEKEKEELFAKAALEAANAMPAKNCKTDLAALLLTMRGPNAVHTNEGTALGE